MFQVIGCGFYGLLWYDSSGAGYVSVVVKWLILRAVVFNKYLTLNTLETTFYIVWSTCI